MFTQFGEKGVSAERVAHVLAGEVHSCERRGAALGPHLADQWMLPLALAVAGHGGSARFSCSEITDHARTNTGVIESFLPVRFTLDAQAGDHWLVQVHALPAGRAGGSGTPAGS